MGRNLRFWLAAPNAAPFDPGDAPLALGALLLRASRTDYATVFMDPLTLDALLARRYDLTVQEAAEMLEACARIEAHAPETERFAAVLCTAIDYRERLAIALCLRDMLATTSTGQSDPALLALSQTLLGVHPDDLVPPRRVG